VELAAVVVVPSKEDLTAMEMGQTSHAAVSEDSQPLCSSRTPILGNDVLRSWMEPIRKLGVRSLWLTSRPRERSMAMDLAQFARQGVERFLMISLKSYAEMDLADLLRFHRDSQNSITEAKDARGNLGVSLLDRLAVPAVDPIYDSGVSPHSEQAPYEFGGYAKRILSAKERQELVGDALTGACAMRPSGARIREQVWIGEGASLADSARVVGPTYIGARTIVCAGATIGPFTSVERDCVVDCGTAVEQSTVLPDTYLAPGLLIRQALLDGRHLEDLRSGIVTDLQPLGLGCRTNQPPHKTSDESATEASSRHTSVGAAPFSARQPWLQVQL